jgi:hypothetical protein
LKLATHNYLAVATIATFEFKLCNSRSASCKNNPAHYQQWQPLCQGGSGLAWIRRMGLQ